MNLREPCCFSDPAVFRVGHNLWFATYSTPPNQQLPLGTASFLAATVFLCGKSRRALRNIAGIAGNAFQRSPRSRFALIGSPVLTVLFPEMHCPLWNKTLARDSRRPVRIGFVKAEVKRFIQIRQRLGICGCEWCLVRLFQI